MKRPSKVQATPSQVGFIGYLIFIVSWFLHIPARVPGLGVLRIDLLLVLFLAATAVLQRDRQPTARTATDRWLVILIAYSLLTVPFVEWPGSVLKIGLPNFVKAVVFYYFTIAFIRTEKQLRVFIVLFLTCQTVRVLEPLYLHFTTGYWGSQASMGGGSEFLNRLSGGPFDIVNPNGLAYIVCIILPLMYFLGVDSGKKIIGLIVLASALLYAMILTGSRSGLIGVAIVGLGIWLKSNNKALLSVVFAIACVGALATMSSDMRDRYLSIFGGGEKNAATASERYEGMREQFHVIFHKPIFGHGLGTSAEANYHFSSGGPYGGRALPAHNLYLEVAQELGLLGFLVFMMFLKSILTGFLQIRAQLARERRGDYVAKLLNGMEVWLAMGLIFSFASYGLSSYDWYMFAGMAVVLLRLQQVNSAKGGEEHAVSASETPSARFRGRSRHVRVGSRGPVNARPPYP
jgi:putative inorganic carbon (HCO3(-)) transporter